MTTIEALQNLYKTLGGDASDVANINTIPAMIDALSEIAGSTIELPAVTATDNGDVLTVVAGKWAKAEIPKFVLSTINNATAAAELLEQISTLENWQSILFEYNDTYNLPYAITWNDDDEAEQLDVYINTSTGITKKTYTTAGVTTVSAALTFE